MVSHVKPRLYSTRDTPFFAIFSFLPVFFFPFFPRFPWRGMHIMGHTIGTCHLTKSHSRLKSKHTQVSLAGSQVLTQLDQLWKLCKFQRPPPLCFVQGKLAITPNVFAIVVSPFLAPSFRMPFSQLIFQQSAQVSPLPGKPPFSGFSWPVPTLLHADHSQRAWPIVRHSSMDLLVINIRLKVP
jgi:hypothetical protein